MKLQTCKHLDVIILRHHNRRQQKMAPRRVLAINKQVDSA